jgi:hypothetical protein
MLVAGRRSFPVTNPFWHITLNMAWVPNVQGWPGLYKHIVYDRIYGDFPAKVTVYTSYVYGSGQPQPY